MLAQDKADAAERVLKAAIDRHAEHAPVLRNQLALMYQFQEKDKAAEKLMRRSLRHHPHHAQTKNGLAYFWAQRGRNLDRALELAREANRAQPRSHAILDTLGWVHYKRGEFEKARQYLEASRERAKQIQGLGDPIILDHLGDTYWRLRKIGEATRAWQQASNLLKKREGGPVTNPEIEGLDKRLANKLTAEPVQRRHVAPAPGVDAPADRTSQTQPSSARPATQPAR